MDLSLPVDMNMSGEVQDLCSNSARNCVKLPEYGDPVCDEPLCKEASVADCVDLPVDGDPVLM